MALSYRQLNWIQSQSQSQTYVTTDGQSASLSWWQAPIWGLRLDIHYGQTLCGFVDVRRSLWRENGFDVYSWCWSSPAHSFLGPSPAGLVTIFYCLWFETNTTLRTKSPIFIPQEEVGPVVPPDIGLNWIPKSKSKLCYDRPFSRPVCLGIKLPSGPYDQIFITLRQLQACWCGEFSLRRGRVCPWPNSVSSNTSLVNMYNLHVTIC
jgi:hypothetical protein